MTTASLGKTTAAGRAKKQVRKTVSKARKGLSKKTADGLKRTVKKVNRIIDRTAKAVRKKVKKTRKVKKTGLKGVKRTISPKAKRAGTLVMKIAKAIHKASPNKKWTSCVKEAGAEYRKKHK